MPSKSRKKHPVIRSFYRPRELADMIGVSYRQVLALIARNEIPALKLDGVNVLLVPAEWVAQVTSDLMADFEAFHANRPSDQPSAAPASLGAANPSERPVDHVPGE